MNEATTSHSNQVVVSLDYPFQIDGAETASLTIRRPKVADMMSGKAKMGEDEKELHMVAKLCGVNPEDLKQMDFADWRKVQRAVASFLEQD